MKRHGLHIGIERTDTRFYIALVLVGTLEHRDYEVITPLFDDALEGIDERIVDVFVDASALEGFTAHAMWDDFQLGMAHRNQFRRIALYGHSRWQEYAAKFANWFVSGEVRYFSEQHDALTWLNE
ncbi:STAS/SEC14 domain-containing protein [Pseudoalteromonas sp. SSDWG2]|uniref:STAS/SEC14 domain-containing protein n=1 Tax=Pseudoalteromonas sp. SSDWG2 TaxID=3139391 RepID=UPI003BAC49D1